MSPYSLTRDEKENRSSHKSMPETAVLYLATLGV